MAVALPSFDAFLRSARRTPAVLPHGPTSFYRPRLQQQRNNNSASPDRSPSPSAPSMTPPGSPYYGHFVSLSPTSSEEDTMDTWSTHATNSSGSDYEDRYTPSPPPVHYQTLLQAPHCVAIAPKPRVGRHPAIAPSKPLRLKKKYLKERQRCEIVRRVRAGERQAHLAKEFGVSRAAVCYLLKHEGEILHRAAVRQQRRL